MGTQFGNRRYRRIAAAACMVLNSTYYVQATITSTMSFVGSSYAGTGPGSTWGDTANWSTAALPGVGSLTLIDNGGLVEFSDASATTTVDTLFLGSSAGFSGGVKISAGTFLVNGTGGTAATQSGRFQIGNNSNGTGGVGTVTQNGGYIGVAASSSVGIGGTGTFTLTDGTFAVGQILAVGNGDTGISGAGTFLQSGGTVTLGQNLTVGRFNATPAKSGTGFYQMTGGTILIASGGSLAIGGNGGLDSIGTLTMSNATLNFLGSGGNINVGFGNATTASTTAGTLLLGTGASITMPGTGVVLAIGNNLATGYAELDHNASISITGGTVETGRNNGTGQLVLNDTSSLTTALLNIANQASSTGSGTVTVNGGNLTVGSVQFGTVGTGANRLLNILGGIVNIGSIQMATQGAGATNLTRVASVTGGVVTIGAANINGGYLKLLGGTVSYNGGTLGSAGTIETSLGLNVGGQMNYGSGTFQVDSNTLNLTGTQNFPAAGNRTVAKTGSGTLIVSGPFSYGVATANGGFNTVQGTLRLQSNGGGSFNVAANGGSTSFEAQETMGSLTIGSGAAVGLNVATAGTTHGVTTFSIAGNTVPTGKLDITNNNLVINYSGTSPLANVQAQVISGYSGGAWNGQGIVSSKASQSSAHPTGVGYGEASAVGLTGSLGGVAVDSDTVIVRYTYDGDANLNGSVDSNDFDLLAANFGSTSNNGWIQGDFNYDGIVNTLDFNALATNYGLSGAAAEPLASPASLGALVPEPASIAMVSVGAMMLVRRRRAV